ncbi:MAG: hypothetical protein SV686_12195 [Thermodesulfobacteriota bacterium]|nr:hypothetical protein [Thermodesulfobacteriota bacterium]
MSGQLSTGALCTTVLKPLADLLSKAIREFAEGNDPSRKHYEIDCPDPGLERGA